MKEKKKLTPLKIILRILAGLLAVVLILALVLVIVPLTETVDKTTVAGSADWMADLPDGLGINDVVLPGTHDSATQYVQLAFFSKCQALSIGEQLEAGFRYLDIRLGGEIDALKLMHGFTNCKTGIAPWATLYLDTVLDQCYSFLKHHPTEFIVFAVKQEHGDESATRFQELLNGYIEENPEYWLQTDTIPTVGEARGKIVLMRRYEDEAGLGAAAGIPLLWEDQGNRDNTELAAAGSYNGGYYLSVQDRYKYDTEDKWAAFTDVLDNPVFLSGPRALNLNFLSTNGNTSYGHPYKYAKELNARLLEREIPRWGGGWIAVDFASAPIAEHIYSANFQ